MKAFQNGPAAPAPQPSPDKSRPPHSPKRIFLTLLAILAGLGACGVLVVVFALAMAYPNLPALDTLTDYRPKMPLRIFTADNVLIGEFGEERRTLVRFKDIPDVMKKAVLAIEDDRYYEHGGIDYWGILRAALHNATGGARQGASTITQQVARNFFLSSEQTLKRKAYGWGRGAAMYWMLSSPGAARRWAKAAEYVMRAAYVGLRWCTGPRFGRYFTFWHNCGYARQLIAGVR